VELGPFATNRRGVRGGVEIRALPTTDLRVERPCEQLYVRPGLAIVTLGCRTTQHIIRFLGLRCRMWDVYKNGDAKPIPHLFIPLRHRLRRHRVLWHIPHHTLPAFDLEPKRTFPATLAEDP
jgi:hypothetical protein